MEIASKRGGAGGVESIDLPDEAATAALAAWAAGFVRRGDFMALAGDLGAGKTTFARAFLRAVLDDPELEAPSPTFTLMQVYEGPEFPVVHADFYRLRGAEELAQLGWDEIVDGAVDAGRMAGARGRSAAARPARNRVRLRSRSRARTIRRAEVRAHGALPARFTRARAIERLLQRAGWAEARREPICRATRRRAPTSA